jgi:5-methylcytosine-specific restriction endonuclease McrA
MNKENRATVLERDKQTYQVCGKCPAYQVHHIKARCHGGEDILFWSPSRVLLYDQNSKST